MTTSPQTPPKTLTWATLAGAVAAMEWLFLKQALAILVGVLPFALAGVNTSGKVLAVAWGLIYGFAVASTMRVYLGLIWDGVLVAFGHDPKCGPVFERAYEENKGKIAQARAVVPRPILWLLDLLQQMNPFALTALLASLYVKMMHPAQATPPVEDPRLGRADVWAVYETRQAARRLDPRELMPAG